MGEARLPLTTLSEFPEPPLYIDDTAITTAVKTHLATDGPLKTMTQISVKTVENTVYFTGVAATPQAKNRAEEIARQVDGVLTVVNNITIQP